MFKNLFRKSSAAHDQSEQKKEPPKPTYRRKPWDGDMILKQVGSGKNVSYLTCSYPTVDMRWVSREMGEDGQPISVRTPVESRMEYPKVGFIVAGKFYASLAQLTVKRDIYGIWCEDCYGREVFCVSERFPCFDSSDFLHENRFYRWFFLRENGKLWRIFSIDETPIVSVTKDVRMLENTCWTEMQYHKYND